MKLYCLANDLVSFQVFINSVDIVGIFKKYNFSMIFINAKILLPVLYYSILNKTIVVTILTFLYLYMTYAMHSRPLVIFLFFIFGI